MANAELEGWRNRTAPAASEQSIEGYAITLELLDYIYQLQALHGQIIAPDTATVFANIRQRIVNLTANPPA